MQQLFEMMKKQKKSRQNTTLVKTGSLFECFCKISKNINKFLCLNLLHLNFSSQNQTTLESQNLFKWKC